MKLIMENWRLYSSKSDFEILCERHTFNLITESQLVEGWENLVLTEMNELIEEGVLDVLSVGYEKGKQLVGKAKETWDAAIWNVTSFLLKLSTQAEKLIQTVSRGLGKIASVIKKVIQFVNRICNAHPILCRVVKVLMAMIALAAAMGLFGSAAQAAVQVASTTAEDGSIILGDEGFQALKGTLQFLQEDSDPETQQLFADSYKWLVDAHNSETLHDVSRATEDGQKIVQKAFTFLESSMIEIPQETEDSSQQVLQHFINLGERVVLKANSYTETVTVNWNTSHKHIEWQSLGLTR
tara:strand:- start:638 stop:1525 length:888 start_codon:yes stop_codon:yes gene_type:complete